MNHGRGRDGLIPLWAGEGDLPFPVTPIKAVPLHRILAALLPFAAPVLSTADRLDRISQ